MAREKTHGVPESRAKVGHGRFGGGLFLLQLLLPLLVVLVVFGATVAFADRKVDDHHRGAGGSERTSDRLDRDATDTHWNRVLTSRWTVFGLREAGTTKRRTWRELNDSSTATADCEIVIWSVCTSQLLLRMNAYQLSLSVTTEDALSSRIRRFRWDTIPITPGG